MLRSIPDSVLQKIMRETKKLPYDSIEYFDGDNYVAIRKGKISYNKKTGETTITTASGVDIQIQGGIDGA